MEILESKTYFDSSFNIKIKAYSGENLAANSAEYFPRKAPMTNDKEMTMSGLANETLNKVALFNKFVCNKYANVAE